MPDLLFFLSLIQASQLVKWCFEPSQPQGITSGLNTNFRLSPSYSFHKSSYHNLCFFQPIYIPWALNMGTCLQQGDLFHSSGLHRNRVLATANTGKIRRGFGQNAGKWMGRVEISKEEIPGSKHSMYGYILTPGFKARTFKLCALTRWDFNFCVRSSPLRDKKTQDVTRRNTLPHKTAPQELVTQLALLAQSTTKDYIRAEGDFHKEVHS